MTYKDLYYKLKESYADLLGKYLTACEGLAEQKEDYDIMINDMAKEHEKKWDN